MYRLKTRQKRNRFAFPNPAAAALRAPPKSPRLHPCPLNTTKITKRTHFQIFNTIYISATYAVFIQMRFKKRTHFALAFGL